MKNIFKDIVCRSENTLPFANGDDFFNFYDGKHGNLYQSNNSL